MENKKLLNLLGFLFLLTFLGAILNNIYYDNIKGILWMCYLGLFIIGIGLIYKKSSLIVSQLNIVAIPSTIWAVDFLSFFFIGRTLFGITDYMFTTGNIIGKIISLQHVFTLPISLYSLSILKVKNKNIWIISFIQLIVVYFLTLMLTNPEGNINYVYNSNITQIEFGLFYSIIWFLSSFICIYLTNYLIVESFYKKQSM